MVASVPNLLQTKLAIPTTRATFVPRPRLTEQFNRGLSRPLTLICAPAGFGKTTLLSEWLDSEAGSTVPLAWVSLDEDDNDPVRFLTYFICALETIASLDGAESLSLLHSPQPVPPKVILISLISHLEASPHHFAVTLDDYHLVTTPTVHEAVAFLLDHLPPQMRLVLISREDPPLPLARLRGRGQLSEIRADDLRFTQEEATAFLQQTLGVRLTTQQVIDLENRTEGWIVGLQLAALAMQGHQDVEGFISAFTGSHRFILDYLTEEVLNRQPEALQTFLLQTSILDRLCGPLCDAVTGRTDGQTALEQIEHDNLFLIPLDNERYWYRYHQLFAEMLRNLLKRANGLRIKELHHRASVWLAEENLVDESVNHAIAAGDFELAATVLESSGSQYFADNWRNFGMQSNVEIPDEVLLHHPLLAINIGMWHGLLGRAAIARKYVRIARAGLATVSLPLPEMEELTGFADAMEAMSAIVNNDMDRAFEVAEDALRRLAAHHVYLRALAFLLKGHVCQRRSQFDESRAYYGQVFEIGQRLVDIGWTTRAAVHIGDTYVLEGRLHDAELTYRSVIQKALDAKKENVLILNLGIAYGGLALIHFERNQLEEAANFAVQCIKLCEEILPYHTLTGYAVLARISHLSGDNNACRDAVQNVGRILDSYSSMASRTYVLYVTHLWRRDDAFVVTKQFLIDRQTFPTEPFDSLLLQIITIRLLIEQAEPSAASQGLVLLDDLSQRLEASGSVARWIEMFVLKALALDILGQVTKALETLDGALRLAEPEGFVRTFVDEGHLMATLLRKARAGGNSSPYVTKLLAAFHQEVPAESTTRSQQPHVRDFEHLSERELEVLRLIADGSSNRDIAEALVVSLGTVKKHLNNIFLKLDAHSRTQVIAIARKHNLL